jgi:hypothetical protein
MGPGEPRRWPPQQPPLRAAKGGLPAPLKGGPPLFFPPHMLLVSFLESCAVLVYVA